MLQICITQTQSVVCGFFLTLKFSCLFTAVAVLQLDWKFPAKSFFLNNYCGYFIKELPNGFSCLDNVTQTLGMLLDFRKAKNTRLASSGSFFFTLFSSLTTSHVFGSRYPKHGKQLSISLIRIGKYTNLFIFPPVIYLLAIYLLAIKPFGRSYSSSMVIYN